jgi:hypothetical protein
MDPFKLPANRKCRKNYTPGVWKKSLEILNRTVMIGTRPERSEKEVAALITKIRAAAKSVFV